MQNVVVRIDGDAENITANNCDLNSKIAAAAYLMADIGKETGLEASLDICRMTALRMLRNENGSRRLDVGINDE